MIRYMIVYTTRTGPDHAAYRDTIEDALEAADVFVRAGSGVVVWEISTGKQVYHS